MPRLTTRLIRRARAHHPLLPLLLPPCRDLRSAINELRWLREHSLANRHASPGKPRTSQPQQLHQLCLSRARGKPLQYILGSQPFGPLDILCKRGVLIPRPETENITAHLGALLLRNPARPSALRILDLCTGTGCIPLLLHALLGPQIPALHLHGIDISPTATALAQLNLTHNTRRGHLQASAQSQIAFSRDDIFATGGPQAWRRREWDVLVANPPYISPSSFDRDTSRSVRNHEPRDALVPLLPETVVDGGARSCINPGDAFYPRLLELASRVAARVLLVEVADMAQAERVAAMVVMERGGWEGCEIWRDWPAGGGGEAVEVVEVRGESVRVKGEGNGRAVLAWRGEGGGRMVGK